MRVQQEKPVGKMCCGPERENQGHLGTRKMQVFCIVKSRNLDDFGYIMGFSDAQHIARYSARIIMQ